MRNVAKLLAVLLPLAVVSMGCRTTAGVANGAPWSTEGWVTVYSAINNVDGTLHFHVGGGGFGFLEIQRIFVNDTATEEGATVLFDFTASPTHQTPGAGHFFWVNHDLESRIVNAGTAYGRYVLESSGNDYRYGGGFGSPLLGDSAYIGFVVRTDSGGNARFAFGGYPGHVVVMFGELAGRD